MNSKQKKLSVTIQKNELSIATIHQMWQLYKDYYHSTYDTFVEQLTTYQYLSFFKQEEQLVGFACIETIRQPLHGRNYLFIRFGQAIIDPAFRGKALIPITAAKLSRLFWKDFLFGQAYFWANTLTYTSYLVFAKTLSSFYPSYKHPTPYAVKDLIDFIGLKQYGEDYNPALGTVHTSFKVVNDFTTEVQTKYLEDKDIQFFTSLNAVSYTHLTLPTTPYV